MLQPTKEKRKPSKYEEMFEHLPAREVLLDSLTDGEKSCPVCGTRCTHR